jgi:hypothetical protein
MAGAATLLAIAGMTTSAMADQEYDVNSVTTPAGVYNFGTGGSGYYAGIIQFGGNLNPQGTALTVNVLCDDPNNEVNVGTQISPPYTYYISSNVTGAGGYLAPLPQQTALEVEGLDAYGLNLYSTNGVSAAATEEIVQLAMWQLEGETGYTLTPAEQAKVTALLDGPAYDVAGNTHLNWALAAAADSLFDGVTWYQLEDPDGANVNAPTGSGQVQGQLGVVITPPGNGIPNIPEPGTLGLLGAGLLGLARFRRRKQAK